MYFLQVGYRDYLISECGGALKAGGVVDLQLDASLPLIVLPQSAFDPNAKALAINAGRLRFSHCEDSHQIPVPAPALAWMEEEGIDEAPSLEVANSDEFRRREEERLKRCEERVFRHYNTYVLSISDLQIYLTTLGESVTVGRPVLSPISLHVAFRTIFDSSKHRDDPGDSMSSFLIEQELPFVLIHGNVTSLQFTLSPNNMTDITALLVPMLILHDDPNCPVSYDAEEIIKQLRSVRRYRNSPIVDLYTLDSSMLHPEGSRMEVFKLKLAVVEFSIPDIKATFMHNSEALTSSVLRALSPDEDVAESAAAAVIVETPMFVFNLAGLHLSALKHPFDLRAELKMHALRVDDMWLKYGEPFSRIVDASTGALDRDIFLLDYENRSRLHPLYKLDDPRYDNIVKLYFGHIDININPESVLHLGTLLVSDLMPHFTRLSEASLLGTRLTGVIPTIDLPTTYVAVFPFSLFLFCYQNLTFSSYFCLIYSDIWRSVKKRKNLPA
jgi:hypothetical protein